MNDFVEKVSQKIEKLTDEQVEQLFKEIKSENEAFDSIIESLSSGIVTLTCGFKLLRMNKAAERYLPLKYYNYEEGEDFFDLIDDEEIEVFLRKCINENKVNQTREFSLSRGNRVVFLKLTLQYLIQHKEIAGYIIAVDDVTSSRQQQILTHRMESLSSLTNLAASVAHEIKNPLGAISIHIQLLQKALKKAREKDGMLPDPKFMEKYLDVVNEEITNLNTIVLDFLFAVKPVQAKMELLSPDSIVRKTIDFFVPEFEEKKIKVSLNLECEEERLLIDSKLFKEVLANLLKNAQAALMYKNNGREVIIHSCISSENYVLKVADNGSGMSEETCSRVFEPYYTTKADGTGLGLTTVYKIIKEFQGDINVKSELNKGTIFTIILPVPQNKTMLLEDNQ